MPDSQPDDDDLRERVDTLEALVSDQQQTIQKLMPSRRSVLAGAAGLGIGAAGMSATSGSAAAQTASGQIGTSSEPVDVEAAQVNAQALEADELSKNDAGAEMSVNTPTTIPTGSPTEVNFGSSQFDRGGYVDLTNNQFVIPNEGLYQISVQVLFDGIPSAGQVRIDVETTDAVDSISQSNQKDGVSDLTSVNASGLLDLSSGETVKVTIEQDTGSDLTVYDGGRSESYSFVSLARIG